MDWSNSTGLPYDLLLAKRLVYDVCYFDCTLPEVEAEGKEYSAYHFKINELTVAHRAAKITPKKLGQFVTIWKRNLAGATTPFDSSDKLDLIIVSAREVHNFGQFIFPKWALLKNGVISAQHQGGKRGIRVYPPWVMANNTQAAKTQRWQSEFFLEIPPKYSVDLVRAKTLFLSKIDLIANPIRFN